MSRFTSRFFVAAAAFLLLAGSAAIQAQPSPTPTPGPAAGPGPWSAAHPLWFDLNGDGTPQPNELTGSPTLQTVGCTVVTGYPTVEYALEGMRLGAVEYLSKPCDIHHLLEVVQKALSRAAHNPRWAGDDPDAAGSVEAQG